MILEDDDMPPRSVTQQFLHCWKHVPVSNTVTFEHLAPWNTQSCQFFESFSKFFGDDGVLKFQRIQFASMRSILSKNRPNRNYRFFGRWKVLIARRNVSVAITFCRYHFRSAITHGRVAHLRLVFPRATKRSNCFSGEMPYLNTQLSRKLIKIR